MRAAASFFHTCWSGLSCQSPCACAVSMCLPIRPSDPALPAAMMDRLVIHGKHGAIFPPTPTQTLAKEFHLQTMHFKNGFREQLKKI